jgi:hypothetical protein
MTHEEEIDALIAKVEREWPVRCQLATLAGFKANPKNPRCLMDTEFDLSIRDLYLEVLFRAPHQAEAALQAIRALYKVTP